MTDSGGAPLARTLVEARAQARPRNQMACTRVLVMSRRQPVAGLAKRAQDLVRLVLDLLHGGGQRVDLRQVQLQQEAMVRRHTAVYRGDDVRAAGLQAPSRTIRQSLEISQREPNRQRPARDQATE